MDQSARVGMRLCKPQTDADGPLSSPRIKRLPGIGERALAKMRLEAGRDIGRGHGARTLGKIVADRLNARSRRISPPTKL